MFIVTARMSKRKVILTGLIILAAAASVACLLRGFMGGSVGDEAQQLDSNESRISWLGTYGWEVEPEPVETLQLQLPETLPESYQSYNVLQKEQGLDLSQACGQQVTRYTYTVKNYPNRAEGVQVNLYLCDGLPVAADILCSGAGGFQAGLAFPNGESAS